MTDQTPELTAICDVCLQAIGDGEGSVWVDQGDANDAFYSVDDSNSPLDFLGETTRSDIVAWRTTHADCGMTDNPYKIEVERIRTWQDFLYWSAHVTGKKWSVATDWRLFTLRSLEPQRAAVGGLRPIRPQGLAWNPIGS
ncbi:hypothetical protein [Streptomyces lavendulae]|uniref:hypothetical protein n=1 Tax=Streptomyces lavendulae TaxID=1914 RepID=UPI0024A51B35|nr:hypothetical protein [Streptomyces lavendulae]GLV98553.1 hypothetical protein Slala05_21850 [Streptomyces lavendulae subsp. lavendulae]